MPTGYTHDVQTGKITEFSDFAMTCARAFGALITMRDDPHGTPIPDEFVPSTYHQDALRDAKAHLASLEAMTVDQIETAARLAHEEAHASWVSHEAEKTAQRNRYEAMIAKTEAWTPRRQTTLNSKRSCFSNSATASTLIADIHRQSP